MNRVKMRILSLLTVGTLLVPISLPSQEYDWAKIDEEAFEKVQPTEKILDTIGVRAGMFVGEVGAGGGRVAVRVARRVGPAGRVFANDITASALAYMRARCVREKIQNMEVVEGTVTDPRFPRGALDVVYMTYTYRHLEKPADVLKNIAPALKPGGVLAVIDSKSYNRDPARNEILRNAGLAGYKLAKLEALLPEDDIYLFHLFTAAAAAAPRPAGQTSPDRVAPSVTVPFDMDHNRMFVEVDFIRPDGAVRKARAWVDTGNEALVLQEPLAKELGFEVPAGKEEWVKLPKAPGMRLAGWPLETADVPAGALRGPRLRPGLLVEAQLPAALFKRYHIILDYPARRLTVAQPGVLTPRGAPLPCRVNPETGLFLVEAVLDGETVALGIDNGSSYTWVSDTLTKAWKERHPDWPTATGAVGAANFFGFGFERLGVLMRLPEMRLGKVAANSAGVAGLPQGMFDWYSKKSAGSVRGFIGANVLKGYRLEVDFANMTTYWEAGPPPEPFDLDIVGLNLRPDADGGYTVAAVVVKDGQPSVDEVRPGDRLISVDGRGVAGLAMGAVVDTLRGAPGTEHTLVLERQGLRVTVKAKTRRFA